MKKALADFTNDLGEKVSYINAICRLGVSYHFENEIEDQLNQIFEAHSHFVEENDYDLNSVALLFQVLRQHGFKMSCGKYISSTVSIYIHETRRLTFVDSIYIIFLTDKVKMDC